MIAPRRPDEGPSTATIVRVILTVLGILALLYAAYLVRSVLVLTIVSAFLAVGLDPAVRRLEDLGLRRGFAVAVLFVTVIILLAGFVIAIVPPLVSQVTNFVTDLPKYVQDIAQNNPRIREFVAQNDVTERLRDATKDLPGLIQGSLGGVLGVAGSILGKFFSLITVLVLTIYFLLSLSKIRAGTLKLIPKSRRHRAQQLADPILGKIGSYIEGQLTIALLSGGLAFLFFLIIALPFPIALALWVSIAGLIPLVGATIGAIPAIIVAFFGSMGHGIAIVVYFIVYQQLENYVIAPRIFTRAVDVSPAAVLLAALIGGTLLGFVGALMAIPVAASLKLIMQEVVIPKSESH
ncbi:MAG: AI-2E family transporter [Actinobacteria bacterium]|nr:AI-2E family transporter [Actinomycetota bacterium]